MFHPLSAPAALQLLGERQPVVLDVRDVKAYSDMRIPNAIHVTLATLQSTLRQISRDSPLLIYCYRGHTSRDFAELFADLGFREVYHLEGGFHAWTAAGGVIERPIGTQAVVHSNLVSDWLLDVGGDPDDVDSPLPDGTPPLIRAARLGRADLVEGLIAAGARPDVLDAHGHDALWAACYSGDLQSLALLLSLGLKPDRRNNEGATVLMYAASAGKAEVVDLLLGAGADPALRNRDGLSAVEFAANLPTLRRLRRATRSAA